MPVPVGEMRNFLFPKRMADYVLQPELLRLKASGIAVARDLSFGTEPSELKELAVVDSPSISRAKMATELLSVRRAPSSPDVSQQDD